MPKLQATNATEILDRMHAMGFDHVAGVPCSFLTPLINGAISHERIRYVHSNHEGEALAISAGLWLSGKRGLTLSQNSGLGNMVNPMTSLLAAFDIPAFVMLTWRGRPSIRDEPQHALMGSITPHLLDLMGVNWQDAAAPGFEWDDALRAADNAWAARQRAAIVLDGDAFAPIPASSAERFVYCTAATHDLRQNGRFPTRREVLRILLETCSDATGIIASTGKCGRELYSLEDRPQHFYMAGSMGFAGALGLGAALGCRKRIVALDGDGALLMRMGNLATIGMSGQENLLHILLDNGCHDSTGGQTTVSGGIDFCAAASACGYRTTIAADSATGFRDALDLCETARFPAFVHARISPGSMPNPPRPSEDFPWLASRFREFCAD